MQPKHTPDIPQPELDIILQRFWDKVDKSAENGCWLWQGAKDTSTGYGQYKPKNTRIQRTHRLAYQLTYGPIPKGMLVCHTCDNRLCVNPAHLFLGTIQDNLLDMRQKGRQGRGEKARAAKLTTPEIVRIRQLFATGDFSTTQIGKQFGMSRQAICDIVMRRTWTHIDP